MKVGVPCLDDYSILSDEKMVKVNQKAKDIGYPIMLKATNGGGGKGMRLVLKQKDLKSSLNLAKAESMSAFGSDEIIIEKALIKPRHIEVQIFGDNFGNFIHLEKEEIVLFKEGTKRLLKRHRQTVYRIKSGNNLENKQSI